MAQLVSKKHLLDLVKKDGKIEEAENGFSYKEFLKVHAECIKDGTRLDTHSKLNDGEDKFSFAYEKVKETYLQSKCPPIKYAGCGSSRAAFALAGGKCLKIAINAKGVGQNKQELKNGADETLKCFTQNYAQAADYTSLLTECCAKASVNDFKKMLGIQPFQIEDVLQLVADKNGIDGALQSLKYDYDEMHSAGDEFIDDYLMREIELTQDMIKLLKSVKQQKSKPQMAVISDLLHFYEKNDWNTDVLLPGDLTNVDNWGLVARDGQVCLVILDSGFSTEIATTLY